MKYNKNESVIPCTWRSYILLGMAGLLWAGCSDKVAETAINEPLKQTVSVYDGQPIIEMDDPDYYQGDYFETWSSRLVAAYGKELLAALNEQTVKAKSSGKFAGGSVLIKDVLAGTRAKSGTPFSTHLRLVEPDGETEEFILGVRWYVQDASSGRAKASEATTLAAEDTWLALSPDRFYLQDDDRGNELWPVTFPAVNLADNNRQIEVTFDANGFVSATGSGAHSKAATASTESPNLMLVEAVPIVEPNDVEPCDPCGGGGGSGGSGRIDDWSRGEPTGSYGANSTYFVVKSIRLIATGDGDGASELQMFVKNNDNYNYNFPVSYKYRFDRVVRRDPVHGGYPEHSIIAGADKGWPYYLYYEVPDVNYEGVDYDFNIIGFVSHQGSNYTEFWTDHFPLFNITQHPGSWRVVMSDDDKDYADFSRRQQSEYAADVQTYHMNDGVWRSVYTGFTVREKDTGSSDDPILESGVRRITLNNARLRQNNFGQFTASKTYPSGTFKYTFALKPAVI